MRTIPCDSQATQEVKNVLNYLNSIEEKHMLTGQHTQTMGMEEVEFIKSITGKYPAVSGFELLAYSPNLPWEDMDEPCYTEIIENMGTVDKAYEWASAGGIVTLTWHWFSPLGGRNKAFYAEHTTYDANLALEEGTKEHYAMVHDLDLMAELLRGFDIAKIPVLWRPFHEADGTWFWWGAKGPETAAKLYKFMFNYFTKVKNLHNLIWVWNCPDPKGYVGDEYCDIISRDIYSEKRVYTSFINELEELKKLTPENKGCALAENGVLPDDEALIKDEANWLWFMTWSKEFVMTEDYSSHEQIKKIYASDYFITRDQLPKLW